MRALLDVVLPPTCPGCGCEGAPICGQCRRQLERRLREPPGAPVGHVDPLPPGVVRREWCSRFNGPAREALHALKYQGERRLAEPLGELLALRWLHVGAQTDVVVHVPVHATRLQERGFDQAALLARACARSLGVPATAALVRGERTVAQHGLGRGARSVNVAGAFGLRPGAERLVRGRAVLLVDDVMTTGATAGACARVLARAGAAEVSALTVAREI